LIPFDGVTDKLQDPTYDKQSERPPPVEKEEWQRNENHRDADAVREPVQWMLVLGSVVSQEAVIFHMSSSIFHSYILSKGSLVARMVRNGQMADST
jgi:hypothetical protein